MEAAKEQDYNKIKEFLQKVAKEQNYEDSHIELKAVSSEGANYTSDLYVANISAPHKEDLKLFIKIANITESLLSSNPSAKFAYKMELHFYSKLVNTFLHLYNKYDIKEEDRLRIGKYYGHESTEMKDILALEDLVAKDFKSFDRMKTFDYEYALAAITEMAKFHALGIACVKEKLEDLLNLDTMDMLHDTAIYKLMQDQAANTAKAVNEEYVSKLEHFLKNNDLKKELDLLWKKSEDGFLIHRDFRPSNLMHRNKNGKVEVVPVDYQTCHLGRLVVDLMSFIWTGSDSQFREKHYKQAIEHYYSELTRALKNLHVDIKEVYPRKKFEEELEEAKTLGLLVALTFMNLLTVDPKDAPKIDNMENMMVKPNQIAKDRINGIVGDYVKWGII